MNFLKKNSRYISDIESIDFNNYIQKTLPDSTQMIQSSNRSINIQPNKSQFHLISTHLKNSQSLDQPHFLNSKKPNLRNFSKFDFIDFSDIHNEDKQITEDIQESLRTHKKKLISEIEFSLEDPGQKLRQSRSEVFQKGLTNSYDSQTLKKTLVKSSTLPVPMQSSKNTLCIKRNFSIRESLSESLKEFTVVEVIDFYKAFEIYSSLNLFELNKKKTWKINIFSGLCRCLRSGCDLNSDANEACEKFVSFGYTEYNNSSHFHRCLLLSAGSLIFDFNCFADIDTKFENLLNKLAVKSKMILSVLMNVLFLDCFFKEILQSFKESFGDFKNFRVIFKLSKICMKLLRRQKLNRMLNKTQKSVELIFFLFAGVCIYFIRISKVFGKDAYGQVLILCERKIEDVLSISREYYIVHQN